MELLFTRPFIINNRHPVKLRGLRSFFYSHFVVYFLTYIKMAVPENEVLLHQKFK